MNCDCDRRCGSITILIDWNTTVDHWTFSLTDKSWKHGNIVASCGVKQIHAIPIEKKLCWWIGFCSASDVESCVHNSNVVCSQTRCQIGIFWAEICNKETYETKRLLLCCFWWKEKKRKYYAQLRNVQKKFEPPEEFEPMTFQVPVGRSSHWAMENSHGEQVAGFGVTTTGFHISWVH